MAFVRALAYGRKTPLSATVEELNGQRETLRVLVCLAGSAQLQHAGINYPVGKGDFVLLSAEVGACSCRPNGVISLLEISLPEAA
jgi:mannose-6-phosphate isomerase